VDVCNNFIFSQERSYSENALFGLKILNDITAKAFFKNAPSSFIKVIYSLTDILNCLF
ncbi:DUF2254 domain-containing protein, partial [Francisella tularensis subsp. holarctica]|nr:DUF2254 domain-containing protein [Francisella tularensis subsp. holarctica]